MAVMTCTQRSNRLAHSSRYVSMKDLQPAHHRGPCERSFGREHEQTGVCSCAAATSAPKCIQFIRVNPALSSAHA